jgi:hypothetical protein
MSQSNGGLNNSGGSSDAIGGNRFRTVINPVQSTLDEVIHCTTHPNIDPGQQAVLLVLQKIHREIKVITRRMIETDRECDQSSNWKYAAMVVDRLCLYVFTLILLGTIVGVLVSAPYLVA